MTEPEQFERLVSRVKLSTTAKGDPVPEVSVVEGADADEIERIRVLAVAAYKATLRDLGLPGAGREGSA